MPHAFFHADGNGNVTCLIGTNGQVLARYLYDPFGNELAAVGPLAKLNLYRFSSKEWHAASGLVYYGRRFFDPLLHRWLSRDPVQESGGYNLYGFIRNSPIGFVDPNGQAWAAIVPHAIAAALVTAEIALKACQNICDQGACTTCCNAAFFGGVAALGTANVLALGHCVMLAFPVSGVCAALVLTTYVAEMGLLGSDTTDCLRACQSKEK